VPLPIKLRALSVKSILSLLKNEPAGNYAKNMGSFKTGKKTQKKQIKTTNNKQTIQPGKLPQLLEVSPQKEVKTYVFFDPMLRAS